MKRLRKKNSAKTYMETIYFYLHYSRGYKTDKWRSVFSQFYKKEFTGGAGLYDLSDAIGTKRVLVNGTKFNSREQWMMSLKALLFAKGDYEHNNLDVFNQIRNSKEPRKIKSLGRKVKGFDEQIWNEWKYKIVVNGNYLQFSQDQKLKNILLNTKDKELVEASKYDRIWGIGFSESNAEENRNKWGSNLLGKALMEVRENLVK